LARGSNGRYQCAVSQFRQQEGGTYKITGGSAIFTITSAIQHDARQFEELKQQWVSEMNATGPRPPGNLRFIPLNTQKGVAQVLINDISGKPDQAHTDANIGTPGGTNSFLVDLTSRGAQEWVQGIRERKNIPAGVKMMYEYLRMMPDTGAHVRVHGSRVFRHISSELKVEYNGFLAGGSAQIEAAWESMRRDGTVEITFVGQGLPPELEELRTELVTTFADQARQQLFDSLFQPIPEVDPAEAGDSGGLFGGANFAFKFKRTEEITDLELTLRFQGWTWLKASMDADLTTLFHELDDTYVNEVNTEMSFPASVVIDADPQLENVALSWTASEGKSPEAPVFGSEGGNQTYVITSHNPDNVEVTYNAKVNFTPPSWPIVETSGRARIVDGGNQTLIKPASWIGRHMIFMFVQVGEQIQMMGVENDYLIVNVSYQGPHLSRPISASARITPFAPVEFTYPLGPELARGQAKFSAFGVVGGRLRRTEEQPINFDEEAIFILASDDGIQLVSQASMLPEASLADQLRNAGARPIIISSDETTRISEMSRPEYGNGDASEFSGTVVGVDYSGRGPSLLIRNTSGAVRRGMLRDPKLADRFDDERKMVRVRIDNQNYISSLVVEL
jgi:hypothetical protein